MGTAELLILFGLSSLWIWSRLEAKRAAVDTDTALERPTR